MDENRVTRIHTGFWPTLALLSCLAAPGHAGAIHGSVRTPPAGAPAPATANPYAGNANAIPGATAAPQGRVTDAVLWIDGLDAETSARLPAPTSRPQLVQQDQTFVPHVLAVAVGSEVDFPNRDPIYHNVFSLSPVQRFDLGKYPKGHSRTVSFRRTGVARVFCDIHSNMEAYVVVVPNRAFARPDASGAFRLPDLPPGDYVLVLWHPDFGETRTNVTLPGDGDVRVQPGF